MFSIISMSGNKVSTKEEKEKYVTRIERERVAPDLNHRRGEERKAFRSCSVRLSRTPTLAETCTFHQHLHSTVMAHPAAGRTPDLVLLSHTGAEDRGSLLTQVQARQSWNKPIWFGITSQQKFRGKKKITEWNRTFTLREYPFTLPSRWSLSSSSFRWSYM